MDGNAIDGDDLIFGLEAGLGGGSVGLGDGDFYTVLLHARDEAEGVGGEVVGCVFGGEGDSGIDAPPVMRVGEGDGLIEIEGGLVEELLPGWVLDVVEVDDGISGVDSGCGGEAVGGDVVGCGRAGEVLGDLVVEHVDAGHEAESEDEVGDGAGESDGDALPAGMGGELSWISGALVVAGWHHLTGHLDVAAERDEGEAVVGVAALDAEETSAEADGEDLDTDAAELGDGEVAELVDEDHDAEDDGKLKDCGESGRHKGEENLVRFKSLTALDASGGVLGYDAFGTFAGIGIGFEHVLDRRRMMCWGE